MENLCPWQGRSEPSTPIFSNPENNTAGLALRTCSACAGDYEDPERTAAAPDPDVAEPEDDDTAEEELQKAWMDHGPALDGQCSDEFPAE